MRSGLSLLGMFTHSLCLLLKSRSFNILILIPLCSPTGPRSKLSNGRTVTNLASYNFYNFVSNELLKERAIQTLRTYGVGPCGPPGFYGTQDVHMKIEADIAAFLGTTACIIYAQAFSTISSVIPAFSKRGDVIVADKAVNYSIRKGLQISRSMVRWYEHNDMEDLQRVLTKVTKEQSKKPLTRRFIVTEGVFENVGDMVDLPKIIELKHKFKFRLILDETWSFGVLGRTGRGLSEHQHIDAAEVDMIVGSMAGPLCAAGGFCAGSDEIVEHQRLSAASYTFSAALPAMSATTASETLLILQTQPDLLNGLRENIKAMWTQLDPRSDWVRCTSAVENPIMLMVLKQEVVSSKRLGNDDQQHLLQEMVDEVRKLLTPVFCLIYSYLSSLVANHPSCYSVSPKVSSSPATRPSLPVPLAPKPRSSSPRPLSKSVSPPACRRRRSRRLGLLSGTPSLRL